MKKFKFANYQKTQLRVSGNHKGKQYIVFDVNRDKHAFQRVPLSLNIEKIYEGELISFVKDDKSFFSPFVPIIKDSEDGINIIYYAGDQNNHFLTGENDANLVESIQKITNISEFIDYFESLLN